MMDYCNSRILLTLMMIYPASLPQSLAVMTDVMIFSSYVDLLLIVHYSNNYVVITMVKHYLLYTTQMCMVSLSWSTICLIIHCTLHNSLSYDHCGHLSIFYIIAISLDEHLH